MGKTMGWVKRPAPTDDHRARSAHQRAGIVLGVLGLTAVVITLIGNVFAASQLGTDPQGAATVLPWTFGLSTTGLGLLKIGIAVILVGIIVRLWFRVDSVKDALPDLVPEGTEPASPAGADTDAIETDFGSVSVSSSAPEPLPIHRMARTMWLPMLVMGAMALLAGLILSAAASGQPAGSEAARELFAWTQGTAFLGEGLILAGISFLLGTILAGLREGGGEVQEFLGVRVKTLEMPASAKAFVALMMLGLMMVIAQFVLYIVAAGAAGDATASATWAAWLGPFREVALGTILAAIVLALYTISKALGFQFSRIRELLSTGA